MVAVPPSMFIHFLAHQVIPSSPLMDFPLSNISRTIGMGPTLLIFLMISFSIISVIFVLIQDVLRGKKLIKGLRYGTVLGLIWFIGLVETSPVFGTPLISEVLMAAADVVPILMMNFVLAVRRKRKQQISDETSSIVWRFCFRHQLDGVLPLCTVCI